MFDIWLRELRVAVRALARRPAFALIAALTFALGIGANTAIFTVVRAVLLDDLPWAEPERLVLITGVNLKPERREFPAGYLDIQDWRSRSSSFDGMAARTGSRNFNLLQDGEAERVVGELVESSYFPILGVNPQHGRVLRPEEDAAGIHRVAVIGHGLWERRFGGAADVVGRTLDLDGQAYEIVGIMPEGFRGMTDGSEVWLPMTLAGALYVPAYLNNRQFRWISAVARLREGVTLEAAQAEIERITAGLAAEYPDTNDGMSAEVRRFSDILYADMRGSLLMLLGAAGFVLLIACTNVANLLLSRSVGRRREVALRAALGARRTALLAPVLAEALVLAAVGAALGMLAASWGTRLLVATSAVAFPSWVDFGADGVVLAVMAGLAVASALVFGALPAAATARVQAAGVLRSGGRETGSGLRRLDTQAVLVIAEVALAMMLFVGAGLMVKGFRSLRNAPLGFQSEGVLTLRMDMKAATYLDDERYRAFARALAEGTSALPGVRSAAIVGPGIPGTVTYGVSLIDEDRRASGLEPVFGIYHLVSPDYFGVMGIPLLRGRAFGPQDYDRDRTLPVAILGEKMASALWPGEDPIGKRVRGAESPEDAPWATVVGVVGDVVSTGIGLDDPEYPNAYFPLYQVVPRGPPMLNLMVRTEDAAASVLPQIRELVRTLDPRLPLFDIRTMEERLDDQAAGARFLVLLIGLFAGLALVLAAVGIFGVISHAVSRQAREIGIRMALGARREGVVMLVVRRGLTLAVPGIVVGIAGAAALTRIARSALHGVSPLDPQVFVLATVLLLLVAAAAAALPAWRAARVDPALALRAE